MKIEKYDVFISFPLIERNSKLSQTINTKDYYLAKKLYVTLSHLLKVKTFFSEETLLNNNKSDFWEKIEEVIPNSKVLVVILSKESDYSREFCRMERELYLKREPEKIKIYFLVSKEVHKNINKFDIVNLEKGKPEVIEYDNIPKMERFYNEINNYFKKNEKGNHREVKICRNCRKIFYKGNEINTTCIHHDIADVRHSHVGTKHYVQFNCCNKKIELPNKNAPFEISPGCIEELAHKFNDEK